MPLRVGEQKGNPVVGDLVYTKHPGIPIMEIKYEFGGFLRTNRNFLAGSLAIVAEVKVNMGRLVFTDGSTGWCNLCYLHEVSSEIR